MQKRKAIIVTTYNRPQYLSECLASLRELVLNSGDIIIIVDDNSNDKETLSLVRNFSHPNAGIIRIMKNANKGIKDSLLHGYKKAFLTNRVNYAINIDGDGVVKPEMAEVLVKYKERFPDYIISGFNSLNEDNGQLRNPIIEEHDDYYIKRYCNGINSIVSYKDYGEVTSKVLFEQGNWDFNMGKHRNSFIITKPSLVEHIGYSSSMGHGYTPDIASDFYEKTELPNVTLFGIDAHDPSGIIRAAMFCKKNFNFGGEHIITERLFIGREGYSQFCIKDMAKYINTSHVLIIHPDGYIQNPLAWDDEWLQYDYIGATWDWYNEHMNGNGGFSLRSKKLLDIISQMDLSSYHPEDDIICRKLRPILESEYGIKFAPIEVCKKFSIEGYGLRPEFRKYNGEFGFHGYFVTDLPIPPIPKIKNNKKK